MKKHTLIKIIVLGLYAAIFVGSVLLLPQAAQARDNDVETGRLLGTNQPGSDGFETGLDGPPGALNTGRYNGRPQNNGNSAGLIKGDGFSINLPNPQTHGEEDDVGARAGWSWEF